MRKEAKLLGTRDPPNAALKEPRQQVRAVYDDHALSP